MDVGELGEEVEPYQRVHVETIQPSYDTHL